MVSKHECMLKYIPVENHTEELYKIAVESYGISLEFIPEDKRTTDLCISAIKNSNGNAIRFIPEDKLYVKIINY